LKGTVHDVIVIGAGVAGLECARRLVAAGRDVVVLERARGVGGRCATRRFEDGQPVDFGPVFLHGTDPHFLEAMGAVPGATPAFDWPIHVVGTGAPCQPDALQPNSRRFVFSEGLAALPKHLAQGVNVKLSTTVLGIAAGAEALSVQTDSGTLQARTVVVAGALEQTRQLLQTLSSSPEVAGATALLGLFSSVPSLTVIAGYGLDALQPPWDVLYPEDSSCFQLIAHDSAKRAGPVSRVLVLQARPRWSRERLDLPTDVWAAQMLAEAGTRLGAWAAAPRFTHPHRWRYARLERGSELSRPLFMKLAGGLGVGLAGDVFSPGGGVQAAWLSGKRLAERLLEEHT
jgi:hypothetical protein